MGKNQLPELMTVEEFASYAKVCIATVRRACRSGELPAVKIGGCWRILAEQALYGANK